MNDSTYVGFQLVKLRRNQVMHRQLAETGDIFEAGKGFRKPKRLNKESQSLSLPSLQPRASGSVAGSNRGSMVDKVKEEKKKGVDASSSSTMMQVRDMKAMMQRAVELQSAPRREAQGRVRIAA